MVFKDKIEAKSLLVSLKNIIPSHVFQLVENFVILTRM